jgi:hypothetical protein
MIFKSSPAQAYSRTATFEPGFGCTVADAVVASAAAFPFFDRVTLTTKNQGTPTVIDGGFVANNPTLLAIADATSALGMSRAQLRVLSVGVGHYREPKKSSTHEFFLRRWPLGTILMMLETNTRTIELLRGILMPDVRTVRIDDSFPDERYATDMLESDPRKLKELLLLGRESFSKHEKDIRTLFAS